MKIKKTWIAGFIIWMVAMVSIFLGPQIRKMTYTKSQKASEGAKKDLAKYQIAFDLLTEEDKFNVIVAKKGVLMLNDEWNLIGTNDESTLSEMGMDRMTIYLTLVYELEPIDLEILKQSTEKKMVKRQLPEFQKRLLQSHKAVLLRADDGRFFMVAGRQEALEYQKKYGSECKDCGSK